jgi:membrane fusion protein (multidrug efflux system)
MKTNFNKQTGMKTVVKFLAVLLLVSCGMSKDQMIKKQIEAKKSKILKLQEEIAGLEDQLSDTNDIPPAIVVGVKQMKPEEFKHYITVFGNVEASKYAKVSPEMNGQIRKIHVEEGQHINKGELLVSLINDVTQSSISEARVSLELAATTYEKQKVLWDQGIGSEIQYLQAKTQKQAAEERLNMLEAQLRMSQVRAPFNGIADKIYLKEGDIAGPMAPLVEFVNLSNLTIKADVSEKYVEDIKAGEKVEVTFSSLPDVQRTATIKRTTKVINPINRTFQIELNLENPGEKIRPNMIASIRINDFGSDDAFVVPSIIIKRDITGDYLYVALPNDKNALIAKKRYLTRGISYEGNTMVTKGLSEDDKVIVAGYNLVSSGTYVTVN